jgi:hypothetical protein
LPASLAAVTEQSIHFSPVRNRHLPPARVTAGRQKRFELFRRQSCVARRLLEHEFYDRQLSGVVTQFTNSFYWCSEPSARKTFSSNGKNSRRDARRLPIFIVMLPHERR